MFGSECFSNATYRCINNEAVMYDHIPVQNLKAQKGPSAGPGQGCWAGILPAEPEPWLASQHELPCRTLLTLSLFAA